MKWIKNKFKIRLQSGIVTDILRIQLAVQVLCSLNGLGLFNCDIKTPRGSGIPTLFMIEPVTLTVICISDQIGSYPGRKRMRGIRMIELVVRAGDTQLSHQVATTHRAERFLWK